MMISTLKGSGSWSSAGKSQFPSPLSSFNFLSLQSRQSTPASWRHLRHTCMEMIRAPSTRRHRMPFNQTPLPSSPLAPAHLSFDKFTSEFSIREASPSAMISVSAIPERKRGSDSKSQSSTFLQLVLTDMSVHDERALGRRLILLEAGNKDLGQVLIEHLCGQHQGLQHSTSSHVVVRSPEELGYKRAALSTAGRLLKSSGMCMSWNFLPRGHVKGQLCH
mmetsp:Transcript_2355/g.7150  ORF Transcript_2355/g.7150 Transcript_2355/m.7150 type:complete len:220 (+) Transcript_2355:407-1066(+)